ncbi:hypothetical protein B0T11DRAFT_270926 [Plectosphaerella cucumerina]|uniref:Secreted protein n=1 Tax=Plectosphaerella cucumerina TaxID=40658 RepID=A0A8K0X8V6_9PEZI|nr:hypothetical protein B0T11DRAFT_270926 [Plectosphaerella cucumerina]
MWVRHCHMSLLTLLVLWCRTLLDMGSIYDGLQLTYCLRSFKTPIYRTVLSPYVCAAVPSDRQTDSVRPTPELSSCY